MKSKVKTLLLSVVLSCASVGFAAPVQAHHADDNLWALYGGMVGLLMLDSYASDNHYQDNHRHYDGHRPYYKRRHHHRHEHKKHHRHAGRQCYRKHKHRRGDWDDDDDD